MYKPIANPSRCSALLWLRAAQGSPLRGCFGEGLEQSQARLLAHTDVPIVACQ